MDYHEPPKKFNNHFIYEMSPSVKHYLKWATKSANDMLVYELGSGDGICMLNSSGFDPLSKVVGGDYYVVGLGLACC